MITHILSPIYFRWDEYSYGRSRVRSVMSQENLRYSRICVLRHKRLLVSSSISVNLHLKYYFLLGVKKYYYWNWWDLVHCHGVSLMWVWSCILSYWNLYSFYMDDFLGFELREVALRSYESVVLHPIFNRYTCLSFYLTKFQSMWIEYNSKYVKIVVEVW